MHLNPIFPKKTSSAGFTLIEFVLAIALLAILAAVGAGLWASSDNAQKYEKTRAELEALKIAIFGDNTVNNQGTRLNFGYVGDWGSLPTSLTKLTTAQAPAWSYNTTYMFGAGWKGPYYQNPVTNASTLVDYWQNALVWSPLASPATLTSYGADGAAGGSFFNADLIYSFPTTLWQSEVQGTVLNGTTPLSGYTVEIRYPVNGVVTAFTTNTAADGYFSFSGVPFGVRSLAVTAPSTLGPVQIVVATPQLQVPAKTLNYATPSEVQGGMLLHLDASQGNGYGFPGTGCSDTTWTDLTANMNNGSLTNFATCGTYGWQGTGTMASPYAVVFDGNVDYVNISYADLFAVTTPLTLVAWINATAFAQTGFAGRTGGTIFDGDENGGGSGYDFGVRNDARIWWWPSAGRDLYSTGTVPLNTWTQVAVVWDGSYTRMYIGGALDSSQAGTAPQTPTFLKIGAKAWVTGAFSGSIAEVELYDIALTDAQIVQNCRAVVSRFAGASCP